MNEIVQSQVPTPGREGGDMLLLVDKPAGWTSFDVVNKLRGVLHVKKAGHAGTLDPLATGLLIVCTGKRTKELARYAADEKEYEVTLVLGARTPSGDAETPVSETCPIDGITTERIGDIVQRFVGTQEQTPPMWSAVKVRGERLYRYAHRGVTVPRSPRRITIHAIRLDCVSLPRVDLTVRCSKGTYIRTLVDDIGQALGCGAYVERLRRTRIGAFTVLDARTIDELIVSAREGVVRTA